MQNSIARSPRKARISVIDRLDYFLRSRASKVVVLALVTNTMVAQLLYNSAGQLVLGNAFVVGYLLISAVCSTFAFALFEVSTIFQLHDLMALDASIKADIGAEKLIKRGYAVLAVSSLINFLSVLYFLALAWHSTGGHATAFPLDNLPEPWNWLYYSLHAAAYTAVLFLAGIFGERPRAARRSSSPPSGHWSSRPWSDGGCRRRPRSTRWCVTGSPSGRSPPRWPHPRLRSASPSWKPRPAAA